MWQQGAKPLTRHTWVGWSGLVPITTPPRCSSLADPTRPPCPSGRPGGWCGRDGRERGGRRSGRRVCDQTPGPAGGRRRQPTDDDGGGGEWRRRTTGDGRRTPLLHLSPDRWSSAGGRREWEVETTRCPQALVFRRWREVWIQVVFTRTPQVLRGEEWNATEDYWDRGNPTEKVGRPGKSGLPWESTGILETRSGDRWRPRHSDDCPGRPQVESERER